MPGHRRRRHDAHIGIHRWRRAGGVRERRRNLARLDGFLAVLGIASGNGLLLINHYQQLEAAGTPFGLELVLRGALERLVPIHAGSAAIVAAFVPIIVFGAIPGLEIVRLRRPTITIHV